MRPRNGVESHLDLFDNFLNQFLNLVLKIRLLICWFPAVNKAKTYSVKQIWPHFGTVRNRISFAKQCKLYLESFVHRWCRRAVGCLAHAGGKANKP